MIPVSSTLIALFNPSQTKLIRCQAPSGVRAFLLVVGLQIGIENIYIISIFLPAYSTVIAQTLNQ